MGPAFIDSSCWLALFKGETTAPLVLGALKEANIRLTGSLNEFEVGYRLWREFGPATGGRYLSHIRENARVVGFLHEDVLEAVKIKEETGLASIDAITLAISMKNHAILLTLDKEFEGLKSVKIIK